MLNKGYDKKEMVKKIWNGFCRNLRKIKRKHKELNELTHENEIH